MGSLKKCSGIVILLMTYLQKYALTVKQERDVNVNVFNVITRINESKMLVKYISYG